MKITTVHDKGLGKCNEDQYVAKDNTFVVIDGATSSSGFTDEHHQTGGRIAANTAKDVFSKNSRPLTELAVSANQTLKSKMEAYDINIDNPQDRWAASLAAVRINDGEIKWLQVGDCNIMLIDVQKNYRFLGNTTDYDLSTLLKLKELKDKNSKNIPAEIRKFHKKHSEPVANVKLAVLNGDSKMKELMLHGKESLKGIAHILLFSDGLKIPAQDPENDRFDEFVEIYLNNGIKEVKNYIRSLEDEDSDCSKYPRFKQHDDIAGIAIELD